MLKIDTAIPYPLHDRAATGQLETTLAASLPPHTLMQRAGLATARLAMAIAPHARTIWVVCGPGNNGGDGLEAAMQLQQRGLTAIVTWLGTPDSAPADARASFERARAAGVQWSDTPPTDCDACIDALLGIGANRPAQGRMAEWIASLNTRSVPVLTIDLPTGLAADTGASNGPCVQASQTLSLLTLKPGLFTAQGRDMAGQVWLDTLSTTPLPNMAPRATLIGAPAPLVRRHASHKGSYGDVAVVGGAPGMTGAALLAAAAALHQGAGRVFVGLLDGSSLGLDPSQPELMFRPVQALDLALLTVVCGCGGGAAIAAQLPRILSVSARIVIDADAINSIATDSQLEKLLQARQHRGRQTVLTPHPLEAARLLGTTPAQVQQDRLAAAEQLAQRLGCTVVLKGSGTVIAAPGQVSAINPTGNARLATAGTGDVLAGMIGARLANGQGAFQAACEAVWLHGRAADTWPANEVLTAGTLARNCPIY